MKPSLKIGVISGRKQQYEDWIRQQVGWMGLNRKGLEDVFVYIGSVNDLRGRRFDDFYWIGTYWELRDIKEIKQLYQFSYKNN